MTHPAPDQPAHADPAAGTAQSLARTAAGPPQPHAHDSEPDWPITTWQGWQHFATTPPPTPPRPAPPQPDDPPRSTEEHLACHSQFVTVRTRAINTLAPRSAP